MSAEIEVGTVFEQAGFRGKVIGFLSGLMVIEGQLDGVMPSHAGERDEFAVVIEGQIAVTVDGVRSLLVTGQSMIVPAGKLHEVEACVPSKVLLIG